ncbi:hypothetical protein TRVL_06122 [Trypanosoma vivax]|nr:hypothetical protein TRVL_06122 [Trypanosoma vivax]
MQSALVQWCTDMENYLHRTVFCEATGSAVFCAAFQCCLYGHAESTFLYHFQIPICTCSYAPFFHFLCCCCCHYYMYFFFKKKIYVALHRKQRQLCQQSCFWDFCSVSVGSSLATSTPSERCPSSYDPSAH